MLGWWICIINLPPDKADKIIGREARAPFVLADWEAGVGGSDWVRALLKKGKATQLKNGGYPNRYTARAEDVLPMIRGNGIKPPEDGIWTFGIDEGEEYALPSGWMENSNLRLDNIRTCSSDAILTIDAWDMS